MPADPPRIQYTSGLVTVSEGDEATLECTAEGNPLTEAMMLWRRPNYHFSGTRQTFELVNIYQLERSREPFTYLNDYKISQARLCSKPSL
jgi:hypothetical protein